jgi:hypothetical protein
MDRNAAKGLNMNVWRKGFAVLAAACACVAGASGAGTEGGLTRAEVLEMLPGPCMDDERAVADCEKLAARGESLYGTYLQIAREHTDFWTVQSALSMIREPVETKREVVAALREMLLERASAVLRGSARKEREAENPSLPFAEEGNLIVMLPSEKPAENDRLLVLVARKTVDIGGALWPEDIDGGDAAAHEPPEEEKAVIEALLAVIRECEWIDTVESALTLLKESGIDKPALAEQLKERLAAWLPGTTWTNAVMIGAFAQALTDIGDENDMESLMPMLSHPVKSVRICGALRFGERGGRRELAALEEAKGRETEEIVLQAIDRGIAGIKRRLADGEQGAETEPGDSGQDIAPLLEELRSLAQTPDGTPTGNPPPGTKPKFLDLRWRIAERGGIVKWNGREWEDVSALVSGRADPDARAKRLLAELNYWEQEYGRSSRPPELRERMADGEARAVIGTYLAQLRVMDLPVALDLELCLWRVVDDGRAPWIPSPEPLPDLRFPDDGTAPHPWKLHGRPVPDAETALGIALRAWTDSHRGMLATESWRCSGPLALNFDVDGFAKAGDEIWECHLFRLDLTDTRIKMQATLWVHSLTAQVHFVHAP